MNTLFFVLLHVFLSCNNPLERKSNSKTIHQGEFKLAQLKFERVKSAYDNNYALVKNKLQEKGIDINNFQLYLRAFKEEKKLEIWAQKPNTPFVLIETFPICASSGTIGPKRKQGDGQVPEGFYHIDRFNPLSSYHLSLGVNYPNVSDRKLSDTQNLGGDIFIHGNCVTAGCLPMTDKMIEFIYIYAVEAKNNGQKSIPITFFPKKMTENNYLSLKNQGKNPLLYSALKKGYDFFEKHYELPQINFQENGSMLVNKQ